MTKLNYLKNTYLFKSNGNINEVGKNEYGNFVILNETIFYPQGGGQPTDTGKISNSNGSFIVNNVRLDQNGVVYHYGNFENGNFSIGEKVEEEINSENRINNAKRHSAGHLIDVAVENLGITNIKPTKGFHFPEGCYVEYEGTLEIEKEELTKKLNEELKKLIGENIEIIEENPDKNLDTPTGKKPRFITFKGYKGHGCGGTHIKNSSEIGNINVRKIKEKGGNIKISYEVV